MFQSSALASSSTAWSMRESVSSGGKDGRGVVDKVVDFGDVDVVLAIGADGTFVHLGYDGAGVLGGLAFAPEVGAETAETVSIGGRDYG